MGKIVVFMGSVREGGNTDMLARSFVQGAAENNRVEMVSVADYAVSPCVGCNTCFERQDHSCFQHDDMDKIYEQLSDADVAVFASPVYLYGITAQLKTIVDRLHTPLRKSFKIRKLALLVVGNATMLGTFDAIVMQYRLVLKHLGLEDGGIILVKGVKNRGDIAGHPALKKAYELGLSIC